MTGLYEHPSQESATTSCALPSLKYLYSPILFDSQELILFYLSTRCSCHAGGAAVLTLYYNGRLASANGMEMQTKFTSSASWMQGTLHVFLILQRSVGFQQWNGDGVAPATPGVLRDQPDSICPLVGLTSVMEMESGEDVPGSQPRQQVVRAAQPYTEGL